ncbi:MAG: hypothetical protein NWE93_11835 [Candidatus Bathyarchaeota archaeon]|nr:hypothetical protein [Candidatus Bathyarchaeota archaeon]
MQKRLAVGIAVLIVAVSLLMGFIFAEPQVQSQSTLPGNTLITILIRPDGSISPSDAPIQRSGNLYTLTDDIRATMKIQKSNIILDGAGYTLSGLYNGTKENVWIVGEGPDQMPQSQVATYTIGVDLGAETVEGITIQNLNVKNFSIGMYVWTKNNTITQNCVQDNIVGILLSGLNSTVTYNHIENNMRGLFFGFNNPDGDIIPSDIVINHNSFLSNDIQLNGCLCKDYNSSEPPHSWDDGKEGNFWSDYNGTDADGDGVGDTPYVVDVLNQDTHPLMWKPAQIPVPAAKEETPVFPTELAIFSVAFVALAAVITVALRLLRRKR